MKAVAGIVLAAGGSRRMGGPKQLIELDGKTLLRRAAEAALAAGAKPVTVVLGHEAERLAQELEDVDATVVVNRDWATGMSSSLQAGLRCVPEEAQGVLIALCDQPLVTGAHLRRLIELFQGSGKKIAASCYDGALGVPAVLGRELFGELARLAGDVGARGVIQAHAGDAAVLDLPDAAIDLDTPMDLNSFSAKQH